MLDRPRSDPASAVAQHFAKLGDKVPDIPSIIFELNTSARQSYCRAVMQGRQWEKARTEAFAFFLLKLHLREIVRFLAWKMMAWLTGSGSTRSAQKTLSQADVVLVGHCALNGSGPVAQDFVGFRETELIGKNVAVLALRLPQTGRTAFLKAERQGCLPLQAHATFGDLLGALRKTRRFVRAMRQIPGFRGTLTEQEMLYDLASGRPVSSLIWAATTDRLVERYAPSSAVVATPLERHDWDLLLTHALTARGREVWAVQNCTFSPNDLNMYVPANGPAYRRALPTRVFAIDDRWATVLSALGLRVATSILKRNRFSGKSYKLTLMPGSQRILYIGSINLDKVKRDLAALTTLSPRYQIQARLHPSVAQIPLPLGIECSSEISGVYACAVYADTTMVFQLDCDRRRLVFLDHADLVNQNPTAFLSDWPGSTVRLVDGEDPAKPIEEMLARLDAAR